MNKLNFFSFSRNAALQAALFSALVAGTAGFATTTLSSRMLIEPLRLGSISIFILITFVLILTRQTLPKAAVFSLYISITLIFYGLFHMAVRGTTIGDLTFMVLNFLLMCGFAFILSMKVEKGTDRVLAVSFMLFSVVMFALTIFWGGMSFVPVPHFLMEVLTLNEGKDYTITYSQGITKFFGIAAICASYVAAETARPSKSILNLALAGFFLVLVFLGGARGDAAATVVVVLVAIKRGGKWMLGGFIVFLISLIAYIFIKIDVFELTLVQRFMLLSSNISTRANLGEQSVILLLERLDCLLVGCGYNFFQSYYNLPFGLYPHSSPLELIITFGLFVSIAVFGLAFYGLILKRRNNHYNLMQLLFIFFALISLKSGSIITSWILMAGLVHLVSVAVVDLTKR